MARLILLVAVFAATLAAQGTFTEWTMPTPNSQPHCVAVDSKGRIWYAAIGADRIGYFDPSTETFREVRISTQNAHPHGIAVSPGDVIWFTEQEGNKIGRIDPDTLAITEYPLKNPDSGPHTPIYDGRGNIWFTEQNGNRIGRLNIQTGAIEEFTIPTPNSGPYGMVADRDGNGWFCSFGGGSNRIGRVDARTGTITEYRTPTADSGPRRPWIDSSGRIWITLNRAHKLAMFDPATERFREWDTPNRAGEPYGIVVDAAGIVWYNEFAANHLVRFEPATETFSAFPLPGLREQIRIVAVDAQNRVWYGNNRSSKIGVLVPGSSILSAAGQDALGGAPSTVAPGELLTIYGEKLEGASVSVGDFAAPLFFVSGKQINAQAPFEITGRPLVEIRRSGGSSVFETLTVVPSRPAIFTQDQSGRGRGIIVHADTFRLVTTDSAAAPGEILAIFGTGLGRFQSEVRTGEIPPNPPPQTAARPDVSIAGRPANVLYSGAAPGFVGLYQINVEVPAATPSGEQPLQLSIGSVVSNLVTVSIR